MREDSNCPETMVQFDIKRRTTTTTTSLFYKQSFIQRPGNSATRERSSSLFFMNFPID